MTPRDVRRAVLAAATRLGFVRPGVARVAPLERGPFYERWLAEGRAGDMRFLLHHRKARLDPRTRYPWARSVVSAFFPYLAPAPPAADWRRELRGRIAAYALGPDYHDVVGARLTAWAAEVERTAGCRARGFVDTGPVFEHEWAACAGVGWTGKHTLTLSRDVGSWAFLAELLVEAELEPDPPAVDGCGGCTRCIDACPTAAIEDGYRLEPRRCISYLTIEHRGAIDPVLRPLLGEWLFGCDLCQLACPWNRPSRRTPCDELAPRLDETIGLDDAAFARRYGASAVRRTGRIGLARNAAVVLGNAGNPAALPPLARALAEHDSPLVRGHAAWAIGRLASAAPSAARGALERARRDADASVRGEVAAALAFADRSRL